MEKVCPQCGFGVRGSWHRRYDVGKLKRGSVEGRIPVMGKVEVKREARVMAYVCDTTNLPLLVEPERAKERW